MNYHTLGMLLGLAGTAVAAFLAADPVLGPPDVRSALAGLVAALAALSVGLQRIYAPDGSVYASSPPQQAPP